MSEGGCGCCGERAFILVEVRVGRLKPEEQWRCWRCVQKGVQVEWETRAAVEAAVVDSAPPPEPPTPGLPFCHHNLVGNTKPCECCTCGHPHLQRDGKCGESLVFDMRCHCPKYEPRVPGHWGPKGHYWAMPEHGSPEIVKYDGRGGLDRVGFDGLYRVPVHGWVPLAFIPEWTEAPP